MYIETKNLVKTFNGRNVVDGVSLHVEKGQVVGLLGPNGAGKTTSFYMIVGIENRRQGLSQLMVRISQCFQCISGLLRGLDIYRKRHRFLDL